MQPAFRSLSDVLRFGALLVFLIALPALLHIIGYPTRASVYDGISERAGPYAFTRHQIFNDDETIDIAFVGSSVMKEAIDADFVQEALEKQIGLDANVRSFPFVFQGLDLQYALIRDLLERRRVKLLVTTFSGPHRFSTRPHPQLHRFLRNGDYEDVLSGLPLMDRVAIYASNVLGGPRQLISLIRPDIPIAYVGSSRSASVQTHIANNTCSAPAVVLGPDTEAAFTIPLSAMTPKEEYLVRKIGALANEKGTRIIVINIPIAEDTRENIIWERADWRRILPADTITAGFRPSELFKSELPYSAFYTYDGHFSSLGRACFTESLTPLLLASHEKIRKNH